MEFFLVLTQYLGLVLKVSDSVRDVELYEPFWRRARSFSTHIAFFYEKQVMVETCCEEHRSMTHYNPFWPINLVNKYDGLLRDTDDKIQLEDFFL
jgi:hypothetical protein